MWALSVRQWPTKIYKPLLSQEGKSIKSKHEENHDNLNKTLSLDTTQHAQNLNTPQTTNNSQEITSEPQVNLNTCSTIPQSENKFPKVSENQDNLPSQDNLSELEQKLPPKLVVKLKPPKLDDVIKTSWG